MTQRRPDLLSSRPRQLFRWLAQHFSALAAFASLGLVASGELCSRQTTRPLAWILLALVTTCSVLASVRRVHCARHGAPPDPRLELSLAALLLGNSVALLQPWPWLFFPILCGSTACFAAYLDQKKGWVIACFSSVLVFADGLHSCVGTNGLTLIPKVALLFGFAAIPRLIEKITQARKSEMQRADEAKMKNTLQAQAQNYRLLDRIEPPATLSSADRERWLSRAVREVEGAVGAVLEVAVTALHTHTCAAFLLSEDGSMLQLSDCRSTSDLFRCDAFPAGEGILGAALKQRAAVRLTAVSLQGVNYYTGQVPPLQSVLSIPICEPSGERTLRGVLVADRLEDLRPFSESDEQILNIVATEVLRAIESERLLTWFRQTNDEKERLYSAIEELNQTTKTVDALGVSLEQARSMAMLDFAALTLVRDERGKRRHQVMCATMSGLENLSFADNAGLVSNVVRYGTALPERELSQMDRSVIFNEETSIRGLRALRIFPLSAGDRIVGTLVAGRQSGPRRFEQETIRTLEVLSMQTAQSVLRADLFDQMEQLATTDGLTGLVNHRTFQVRCDESLQLAQRYGKKLSLMLTDIDHFKRVNDTYGHPAGDLVLRGVARLLKESARDTDIVARYGGEEFCVIMPETDAGGAKVIAERLRKEIEATAFDSEQGPLKVTLSLGIATYPESAEKKQELIDLADQCLYFAKKNGRNRSVTVAEMQRGRDDALPLQR